MVEARFQSLIKNVFGNAADPTAYRTRQFIRALLTSFGGRVFSTVVQLFAIPVAIAALGTDRFGVYAVLSSILNWVNLSSIGIGPGLTVQIVHAHADNDTDLESTAFSTALLISSMIAIAVVLGSRILISGMGVDRIFGEQLAPYRVELEDGFYLLALIVAITLIVGVAEAAQAGYQNHYINSLWAVFGSLMTLISLSIVVTNWPTVLNMIIAMFGAPLIARSCNMIHLLIQRPHLLPRPSRFKLPLVKVLLVTGSAFIVAQMATFAYQNFSIFWSGRELGASAAAVVAVMLLLMSLAGSVTMMITQPLWPAIQDAVLRRDEKWTKRFYLLVVGALMLYALIIALVLGVFGNLILSHWLPELPPLPRSVLGLWGLYYLLVTWEHVNYMVLIGLGRFWFASIWFLLGAIIMVILCIALTALCGLMGLFLSLCIGVLATTAWRYPVAIRQTMRSVFPKMRLLAEL